MCIIMIVNRADMVKYPYEIRNYLENSKRANPHGCGLALVGKKIVVEKGMAMDVFSELQSAFAKDAERAVIHFRYATHGDRTADMCHPFDTGAGFLFHNGIFDEAAMLEPLVEYDNLKCFPSDTAIIAMFMKQYKVPLRKQVAMLEESRQKFALVSYGGRIYHNLPNKDDETGIITSNTTYRNYQVYQHGYKLANGYSMADEYGLDDYYKYVGRW